MPERYNAFSFFLQKKFPAFKVRKISLNAGFTCPNKDGTKSNQGCIFCDHYGSGPIRTFDLSIKDQIETFINSHPKNKFIAYFQAHSNTNAPVSVLKEKYEIIFNYPEIIGLFIGTRPDCLLQEQFPLLSQLNCKIYLSVELGLQSIHPKSLEYLNRNHTYKEFLNAYQGLADNKIDTIVHLIVGIPGETENDMLATIAEMNRIKPAGIKFHLFHVLKNTPLFSLYKKNQVALMNQETYVNTIVLLLSHLDPGIVIHRFTGERDKEIFVAPQWALDKAATLHAIRRKMARDNIFQGCKL